MSFMTMLMQKMSLPSAEEALPGRAEAIVPAEPHFVSGRKLIGPYPEGMKTLVLGMGCFWGAERLFWQMDGVWVTAVGYAGGHTPNPTYQETCTGRTAHTEVVLVVYDPQKVSTEEILQVFWQSHDPTQGMRQGNDTGTQYRSAIYLQSEDDMAVVDASRETYQKALVTSGIGAKITTEIRVLPLSLVYFAEDYHQQYLAKNPAGYCGIGGTGVSCPVLS